MAMSLDLNALPESVREYINAELQRVRDEINPPPAPEPSTHDKLRASLARIEALLHAERKLPTGSDALHQEIATALAHLETLYNDHANNHTESE